MNQFTSYIETKRRLQDRILFYMRAKKRIEQKLEETIRFSKINEEWRNNAES